MQLDRSPERATPLPSPDMTPPAAPRPSLQLPPLETKDGRGAPAVWRLFFFSRRRRHTILVGDWSSDVCSSDLGHDARGHAAPPAIELAVDLRGHRPCPRNTVVGRDRGEESHLALREPGRDLAEA